MAEPGLRITSWPGYPDDFDLTKIRLVQWTRALDPSSRASENDSMYSLLATLGPLIEDLRARAGAKR